CRGLDRDSRSHYQADSVQSRTRADGSPDLRINTRRDSLQKTKQGNPGRFPKCGGNSCSAQASPGDRSAVARNHIENIVTFLDKPTLIRQGLILAADSSCLN